MTERQLCERDMRHIDCVLAEARANGKSSAFVDCDTLARLRALAARIEDAEAKGVSW